MSAGFVPFGLSFTLDKLKAVLLEGEICICKLSGCGRGFCTKDMKCSFSREKFS